MKGTILEGDCLEVMGAMADDSIDAVVTDPPYGIRFMGKAWDAPEIADKTQREGTRSGYTRVDPNTGKVRSYGGYNRASAAAQAGQYDRSAEANRKFQQWTEVWAREAFRVLKPGGHILVSGSPRTYHRMASGVEDAGFEIRDTVNWLYGSGFPKSKSMRDIDRPELGTALKPAHEPIVLARKPLAEKTVARQVLKTGTAALNIDGCRVRSDIGNDARKSVSTGLGHSDVIYGGWADNHYGPSEMHPDSARHHAQGRWPANLLLSHSPDCKPVGTKRVKPVQKAAGSPGFGANREDGYTKGTGREYGSDGMEEVEAYECAEGCPVADLDAQSGTLKSGGKPGKSYGVPPDRDGRHAYGRFSPDGIKTMSRGDSGGASRFFYVAKASRAERNAGLEGMPERRSVDDDWVSESRKDAASGGKTSPQSNHHPTVKPLTLMRYLVRLVTPPGGTVLDPFAGSGTTVAAAMLEGFDAIGIEREAEYAEIARRRVEYWRLEAELEEEKLF